MIRASLLDLPLTRETQPAWKFVPEIPKSVNR
jgi:hypothetical protein